MRLATLQTSNSRSLSTLPTSMGCLHLSDLGLGQHCCHKGEYRCKAITYMFPDTL